MPPRTWPSASFESVGTLNYEDFAAQSPGPPVPLPTLRRRPHERQRMTRGHRDSLDLRCRALSSPSPRRFIPALTTHVAGHPTLAYRSSAEFEREHAELAQPALEAPVSANGSVASISPSASHGLTTRRISTVDLDFAANGPFSAENAPVIPSGPAHAATDGDQGTTATGGLSAR